MGLFGKQNSQIPRPLVLISMDGVGVDRPGPGNAVTGAKTPNLDSLWPKYPHGMLQASGLYVGLPEGTDGNSEVGHVTMGAGKVILQDLPRIDNAIRNKTFHQNPMLLKAIQHAKQNKSRLHLMGLIGTGYVHSSFDHILELINLAVDQKMDPDMVCIHAFLDGRDSALDEASRILERLESYCLQKRMGRIVSVIGRAYAMDRNKNWIRTKKAYDMLTEAKATISTNWRDYLKKSYELKIFDEYIEPAIFTTKDGEIPVTVKENDAIIFFNFRPDRALQLTQAFESVEFNGWERRLIPNLFFVGLTDYKKGHPYNKAFPPEKVTNPLGKVLSEAGLKQLRISESEKFPHVTYFFNGGNGEVFENEVWVEVPSPKDIATYDQKPQMSMEWMTDVLIEKMQTDEFDFIMTNFAGPDMVAHTGVIPATMKAMEVCDACIGKIVTETLSRDGAVIITADHGNAEEMINLQNGEPDTKHSTNPVPVMIISKDFQTREITIGSLADIATTVLHILQIPVPPEMTGRNLLE